MDDDPEPGPAIGDAFGEVLRAHHEDGESYEVTERDDGWIAPMPDPEQYFAGFDDWPERQRRAMEWVEGRVLDVGCGAGRHALYLEAQGHEVTGVDVSPGAVAVARDRGVSDVRQVDVEDVTTDLEQGYDTVCLLGGNFGLVGTAERAPVILTRLSWATGEDGCIVAESMDPTATDEEAHLAYHERNRERGSLPGAVRMRVRHETMATPWYDFLHAAPETMRDLVSETPWTVAEVIDGEGGHYVARLAKE